MMVIAVAVLLAGTAAEQAPTTGVMVSPKPQQKPPAPAPAPPAAPKVPRPLPKVMASERDTPLRLGDQTFHFVKRVQRIEGPADETTEWWELRDANGGVIYREAYQVTVTPDGFESTTTVDARAFATKQGSGILVEGGELPSAPRGGTWVQVFGFKWGPTKAVVPTPFGPAMSTDGEFLDIATDPRRQARPVPGRTVIAMNDILRFRVWTGNFDIIYPVLINWITGKVEPSWHCLRMTSRGQVDRCDYPVQVEPVTRSERSFVRLFPEPSEDFKPRHVVVEAASKVEFLEAEVPISWSEDKKNIWFGVSSEGDTWLKVRIDGQEGWIHTQEDFDAVGLPQSG